MPIFTPFFFPIKVSSSSLREQLQLLIPLLFSVLSLSVSLPSQEKKVLVFLLSFWLMESLQITVSIPSQTRSVE